MNASIVLWLPMLMWTPIEPRKEPPPEPWGLGAYVLLLTLAIACAAIAAPLIVAALSPSATTASRGMAH